MFLRSLQLKLILIFFILISTTTIGIGVYSINKMEEIYYNGFIEEMLNTISSFGVNIENIKVQNAIHDTNSLILNDDFMTSGNTLKIDEQAILKEVEEQRVQETVAKIYANFNIYFSLNNISRRGLLLGSNYQEVLSKENIQLSENALKCIQMAQNNSRHYYSMKDPESNAYVFAYNISYELNEEKIEFIIFVAQDMTYINNQLNRLGSAYLIALIGMLLVTIFIVYVTARSITKPIAILTSKAESIANGSIEHIALSPKSHAGYEISKLIDTFNVMILQTKENMNEISSEKNKLETILLHLADGVLAFNLKGKLIHVNLAAKKMLSLDAEDKTFEGIFSKLNIDINLEKIIYLEDWTSSEEMVRIQDKYFNIFFAPFKDEQNRPSGVVAVIQDMTDQAKLEEMRKEFVANVSHELKTPLTSIKTYSETMLEQDLDEESREKFMNVILTEANRMTRLVSDLLQLSKFDYKKVAWNKISFDITELTKQICDKHRIQADQKGQVLECYVTSNVPSVYGDRDGIERVITNIITNSIKYTPENGNIKVYVGAVYDDAYIKIIDNGIGIPKEDLPRVFERFYRVDKARSREMGGTGLGLPIAKEIIEANGGSISIESDIGKGTEVIIKVPLEKKERNAKMSQYYFTSESVTEGHPDKLCDYISDSILDACLAQDENSRVAVETFASKNLIVVAGQITTNAKIEVETIVRDAIREIGYDNEETDIDYRTCNIIVNIDKQSSDIAMGVDIGGAGDQGIMFGYATDEAPNEMPYALYLAHALSQRLTEVRKKEEIPFLRPDGKTQVTIEYEGDKPKRVETILISTQHLPGVSIDEIKQAIVEKVIKTVVPEAMMDAQTKIYVNPTGRFVIGGPLGDTGLTGRKIIVDTYGGYARHGGGAFSGKDASKVDRSAAYMLRHIAKNIVANGYAKKCEIQLSYAIGMEKPLSLFVDTFGTGTKSSEELCKMIMQKFDLTPKGIIQYLNLKKPIYRQTTNYGHFGKENLPWEKIITW